jgi:hypothetical protein
MLLEHVWNSFFEGLTNVVGVHVNAMHGNGDRVSLPKN